MSLEKGVISKVKFILPDRLWLSVVQHFVCSRHYTFSPQNLDRFGLKGHRAAWLLFSSPSQLSQHGTRLSWASWVFTLWMSHLGFLLLITPFSYFAFCSLRACRKDEKITAGWHQWRKSLPLLECSVFTIQEHLNQCLGLAPLLELKCLWSDTLSLWTQVRDQ